MRHDLMQARTITCDRLEIRSDENGDGTLLEGVAVPFNQRYDLFAGYAEVIDPDCDFGGRTVKISRDHGELIGKVIDITRNDTGLMIRAKLSDTQLARETVQLVRDGVCDSFSIGFKPVENRIVESDDGVTEVHRRKVDLIEVAVTGTPAYPSATITSQRTINQPNESEEPMTDELAKRFDKLETETRNAIASLKTNIPEPSPLLGGQWRSMGDYLHALSDGSEEAARFQDETRDAITSPDINNQTQWVADQIRLVQSRRSVANLFVHSALPATGLKVEYLTLGTNTMKVAQQANETGTLATGKITLSSQAATVATYGGYTTLSQQVIDRSTTPALDTALRALTLAYSNAIEDAARAYLKTAITGADTNKVETPAAPAAMTADQWIEAIIEAAEAVDSRGASLGSLVVGKDVFTAMAKLTRSGNALMDVSGKGSDTLGSLDLSGVTADLFRVPVRMMPAAAANTAVFLDPQALTLWESGGPFQLQQQNIKNLTGDYSVYGYAAFGTTFPGGITPLAAKTTSHD